MALELFELMFENMVHIASSEKFLDQESVDKLLQRELPSIQTPDFSQMQPDERKKAEDEWNAKVDKALSRAEKRFRTGRLADIDKWDSKLLRKCNGVFVQNFIEDRVLIEGYGNKTLTFLAHAEQYAREIHDVIIGWKFDVPDDELEVMQECFAG